MPNTTQKLDWTQLDLSSHGPKTDLGKALERLEATREANKAAMEAVDSELIGLLASKKMIPAGQEPLFSHRFGKVAFALQAVSASKSASAKAIKL